MNRSTTSREYSRRLKEKPIGEPMIATKNVLHSLTPAERLYKQTNPIAPVKPSNNWATQPPDRGFDVTGMSTYVVREADRQQLAVFDKYILGDTASIYNRGAHENAAKLKEGLRKRYGRPDKSTVGGGETYFRKNSYHSDFKGTTLPTSARETKQ